MKTYDVQTIEINAPFDRVFGYLADAQKLPEWTHAFKSISNGRAMLATPNGEVEIELVVHAARDQGTVDWLLIFPDGSVATAYSRVAAADKERSIYSFVMLPPPVPAARRYFEREVKTNGCSVGTTCPTGPGG